METDSRRVVIVGDPQTGKTSLVHRICNKSHSNHLPTWGCSLHLHLHRTGSKKGWIEFVDVGRSSHANTRQSLYHDIHGLIIVHDTKHTYKHSMETVQKWLDEVTRKRVDGNVDLEAGKNGVDVLVVGTRFGEDKGWFTRSGTQNAELLGHKTVYLTNIEQWNDHTTNQFNSFFDGLMHWDSKPTVYSSDANTYRNRFQ